MLSPTFNTPVQHTSNKKRNKNEQFKGAMSRLTHARASENKLLSEILEGCLNLSHRLIVSEVLYQESFYGDYKRIFWHYFEIVCPLSFFTWIYSVLLSAVVVMAES